MIKRKSERRLITLEKLPLLTLLPRLRKKVLVRISYLLELLQSISVVVTVRPLVKLMEKLQTKP